MEKLTIYQHNGICVIVEMMHVEVLGKVIHLTNAEFAILTQLIRRPKVIFSKKQIIHLAAGHKDARKTKNPAGSVSQRIKFLRKKLVPNNPQLARKLIETVYGSGYRLNDLRKGRQ